MKLVVWDMEMADQTANTKFPNAKRFIAHGSYFALQHHFYKTQNHKSYILQQLHLLPGSAPDMMKVLFDSVSQLWNTAEKLIIKTLQAVEKAFLA